MGVNPFSATLYGVLYGERFGDSYGGRNGVRWHYGRAWGPLGSLGVGHGGATWRGAWGAGSQDRRYGDRMDACDAQRVGHGGWCHHAEAFARIRYAGMRDLLGMIGTGIWGRASKRRVDRACTSMVPGE